MQSETIQETIVQNTEAQIQLVISDNMKSDTVQSQLTTASQGCKTLIELKTSLDSYNAFYLGVLAYTNGVAEAASGAGVLSDGTYPSFDHTNSRKS